MAQLSCIISICKHINVASVDETGFDMLNEKPKSNYIFYAFCKPK